MKKTTTKKSVIELNREELDNLITDKLSEIYSDLDIGTVNFTIDRANFVNGAIVTYEIEED